MIQYLNWLHDNVSLGNPCALVLDCYKAHRTDAVKEEAENLGFELIFVPACGTSIYQPLKAGLNIPGLIEALIKREYDFKKDESENEKDQNYETESNEEEEVHEENRDPLDELDENLEEEDFQDDEDSDEEEFDADQYYLKKYLIFRK